MKKVTLSPNALTIAQNRYFMEGETWDDCSLRVARNVAQIETNKQKYTDLFNEIIYNMDFLPAGRILRNCERQKGSLLNCFHIKVGDSIEEIGQSLKDSLVLWSEGGGVGITLSDLRPKGDLILGKGGKSSGLVSFMEAFDASAKTIESGGARRAAALGLVDISHPEIVDYIDAKISLGKLSHFNISVAINNDFLEAVEADKKWTFKFKQKEYGSIKARDLWNKIISNMLNYAEPGIINWHNFSKNNTWYFSPVTGTNPCHTGDSLVAVADGRKHVTFKQLADEGNDIPVFSRNNETGKIEVKMMRNPRVTGYKQKIYKVFLDNDMYFRSNGTHKITMFDGTEKEVHNLKPNDRLHHMIKYHGKLKTVIGKRKNNSINRCPEKNYFKKHRFIGNGNSKGYTINQLFDIAIQFTKSLNRRPMIKEWQEYCKKNNYPFWQVEMYKIYGNHKRFFDVVCENIEFPKLKNQYLASSYKKYLEIKNITDLDIFWNDGIKVNKYCEVCGNSFIVDWDNRERGLCSIKCTAKKGNNVYKEKRRQANLNFKVIKVEEDGFEDVYNGTVDDNHNYYVYVGENKTISGKQKLNYINSKNCGETCLSSGESCCLGSIVLPNFITGNVNTNWKKLEYVIKLAIRFLDNVLDVNKYAIKEIDLISHRARRIGLGVIGLAEYLIAKKMRYGSEKAVTETEKLMKFIRDCAYKASLEIAIEKGAFPAFDPIQYCKSSFVRKLHPELRMDIKKYGIRNATLMALAPTGTISLLAEYSSGIEPLFAKALLRKDRIGDRLYVHPKYKEILISAEETPDWFVDSFDLTPKDHFEMQAVCQKYCDSSVSKTINLPAETTEAELSDLLLEYAYDLKGVTVYRDGSREGQILNKVTEEEVKEYLKQNGEFETHLKEGDVKCANGKCEL